MLDLDHCLYGETGLTASETLIARVIADLVPRGDWYWGGVKALSLASKLSDKGTRLVLQSLSEKGWLLQMTNSNDKRKIGYLLNEKPVPTTAIFGKVEVLSTASSDKVAVVSTANYRYSVPLSIPPTSTLKDKDIKNSNSNSNSDPGHQLTRMPPPSEVKPPPVTHQPMAKPPSKRRSTKNPAYPITMDWMPEEDTVQALIQLHGIPEEFLAAELFDFLKFWVQRGDSRPGWDATFMARMKHQWQWRQQHETKQKYTDASGKPISEYEYTWNQGLDELL